MKPIVCPNISLFIIPCILLSNFLKVLKFADRGEKFFLASFYAPLMHIQCPVSIYTDDGVLVAGGYLKNFDADTVLYQRKQLHGRVSKSGTKNVTVRGMFHSKGIFSVKIFDF